jgi:formyltetrahydrofolate deformylase
MFILNVQAVDQPGLVAAIATSLAQNGCNIEESSQFHDPSSGQFFMRIVFTPLQQNAQQNFKDTFEIVAQQFNMHWHIIPRDKAVKTIIIASKQDHCLNDLLYRWRTKSLNIEIAAIVSNHTTAQDLASSRNIPFFHLPVTTDNKAEQEQKLRDLIEKTGTELVILARYMQVLSDQFTKDYAGRIINIHHSFLPGFKGARPYHQAHDRGVKIIGATAHFATTDLDEGPIIAQNVTPVDHTHTPEMMQALGRDTESRTLARAIELYCARRIFPHDGRTIIL